MRRFALAALLATACSAADSPAAQSFQEQEVDTLANTKATPEELALAYKEMEEAMESVFREIERRTQPQGEVTKFYRDQMGLGTVRGVVRNPATIAYLRAIVELSLWDAEGNEIGTALSNSGPLPPNGEFKWSARVYDPRAREVRIERITAH